MQIPNLFIYLLIFGEGANDGGARCESPNHRRERYERVRTAQGASWRGGGGEPPAKFATLRAFTSSPPEGSIKPLVPVSDQKYSLVFRKNAQAPSFLLENSKKSALRPHPHCVPTPRPLFCQLSPWGAPSPVWGPGLYTKGQYDHRLCACQIATG